MNYDRDPMPDPLPMRPQRLKEIEEKLEQMHFAAVIAPPYQRPLTLEQLPDALQKTAQLILSGRIDMEPGTFIQNLLFHANKGRAVSERGNYRSRFLHRGQINDYTGAPLQSLSYYMVYNDAALNGPIIDTALALLPRVLETRQGVSDHIAAQDFRDLVKTLDRCRAALGEKSGAFFRTVAGCLPRYAEIDAYHFFVVLQDLCETLWQDRRDGSMESSRAFCEEGLNHFPALARAHPDCALMLDRAMSRMAGLPEKESLTAGIAGREVIVSPAFDFGAKKQVLLYVFPGWSHVFPKIATSPRAHFSFDTDYPRSENSKNPPSVPLEVFETIADGESPELASKLRSFAGAARGVCKDAAALKPFGDQARARLAATPLFAMAHPGVA